MKDGDRRAAPEHEANPDAHVRAPGSMDDVDVAEGEVDVRGWRVVAAGGTPVGSVRELLVDRDAMHVSYLDVELDREIVAGDRAAAGMHVVLPVSAARLNPGRDEVHLPITAAEVAERPAWRGGDLTAEHTADGSLRYETDPTGRLHIRMGDRPTREPPRG